MSRSGGFENWFATFRSNWRTKWTMRERLPLPVWSRQDAAEPQASGPCYPHDNATVEARYEDGVLKPEKPLPLRAGDRVGVIVLRRPDPARWDLQRLGAAAAEDAELAAAGLDDWDALDSEDKR